MKYIGKEFFVEKIKVEIIAKKFGTPAYCYSYSRLKENIKKLQNNFKSFNPLFCFAVKSNTNKYLLNEISKFGLGADVVSMGELMRAMSAGINPNKIVFSGVGKTSKEIEYAINKKILLINAESKSEILAIEKIAKLKKQIVNIGIRLNPNTDAKTLDEISTGKKENKFGVNEKTFLELVNYVKNSKNLNLKCLSAHIGSQILDYRPYLKMLNVLHKVIQKSNYKFEYVDLGGGMGIDYDHNNKKLNLKKYNSYIQKFLKLNKCKIIFEPGRSIIGDTAVLITNITYIKESDKKDFIILDTGMNDLMRPALYKAEHKIIPVIKSKNKSKKIYEFVGPICETTDKFLTIKNYQKLNENDLIIICDVGAYGMSLSSNYNLRTKPVELLIHNSKIKIINKRQKLSDLV
jgi:diaminopimelate decarboxylase